MDFSFSDEELALRDLAAKIFDGCITVADLRAMEAGGEWFHRKLWSELAKAGLLGVGVASDVGGGEMGFLAVCLLLEQAGRTVAPVPLLATLVMGALPIERFGAPAQRERWLPGVVSGEIVLSAALNEPAQADPLEPATTARRDGKGWKLDGVKIAVPAAAFAARVLVPATTPDGGVVVCLVDPKASGLTLERQILTTQEPHHRMTLAGVRVDDADVLGDAKRGREILGFVVDHTTVGLCITEVGCAERAIRMMAEYTSQRVQFGRPIATFQAVAQRAGDAYIDVEAVKLSAWQAAWRLSAGLESAEHIAIAKFWTAEGGHRALYAAQHLHGGIGVDTDYPLHRYYLLSKQIELTLGNAKVQLARLGALLASSEFASRGSEGAAAGEAERASA
jgi:alkylation response protein AidB-like acyl-CoA dehydrogenase